MDWQRYKVLCERPDVMSRWMLTETAALLPAEWRISLLAELRQRPLPKPPDHKGGADTDMFEVTLAGVDEIVAAIEAASARGATTSQGRSLGGFAVAWRELAAWRGIKGGDV